MRLCGITRVTRSVSADAGWILRLRFELYVNLAAGEAPGRMTRIRQPRWDSATPIRPPCRSTAQRAMASPRPVPPSLPGPCGELTPPRLNRSKTRCHSDRGMPGPSSRTSSSSDSGRSSRRRALTVTRPCGGLCLTALSMQVGDDLVEALRVGVRGQLRRVDVEVQMDVGAGVAAGARARCPRARTRPWASLSTPGQVRPHLETPLAQRHDAGVEPGQVQQRLDQPAQPLGLRQRGTQRRRVGGRRRRRRGSPAPRAAPRSACAARARRWRPARGAAGPRPPGRRPSG